MMQNEAGGPDAMRRGARRALLQVVVSGDCPTCAESRSTVLEMRQLFPDLTVALIDLDAGHPIPDGVVAAPTYLLNGKVISLGNPRREDLVELLMNVSAARA